MKMSVGILGRATAFLHGGLNATAAGTAYENPTAHNSAKPSAPSAVALQHHKLDASQLFETDPGQSI
jgi:hypothetical protein